MSTKTEPMGFMTASSKAASESEATTDRTANETSLPQPNATAGVRYFVNTAGERQDVVMPVEMYERLLDELEDAEDTRIIAERMKNPEFVSWEEVKQELALHP